MGKPPLPVMHVVKAICTLLYEPGQVKDGQNIHSSPSDDGESKLLGFYWEVAKRDLLSDHRFIDRLLDYDKDHFHPEKIHSVEDLVSSEEFSPESMSRYSLA